MFENALLNDGGQGRVGGVSFLAHCITFIIDEQYAGCMNVGNAVNTIVS